MFRLMVHPLLQTLPATSKTQIQETFRVHM